VKAAVFRAPGDVRIEAVPDPAPPGPGELLIKVSKAALCGTDSAEWAHGPLLARPPVVLGHEFTGQVIAAGPEVSGFPAGTRVVSGAGISCGSCAWCAAGRTNLCASYQTLGLHRDGGLAEFVLSPAAICRAVPDALDDTGAAMAQPLAVALHAARRGKVGPGRSCVVIGAGGIGSFVIAAAAALGAAPLVAVDIDDGRLATATVLGATSTWHSGRGDALEAVLAAVGGDGAHVVIEASGAPGSPAAALSMVRRGGDAVIVGLQAAPLPVDLFAVSVREIDVHGTLAHVCGDDLGEAVAVLAGTRLAKTVLGDVIALSDLVEAGLRPLAERKAHGKIVVDVQGSVLCRTSRKRAQGSDDTADSSAEPCRYHGARP
jgi:(R,R)-butanediol dehydrogenase/meso-butanediol dehydrogenase/diacetyl reductase